MTDAPIFAFPSAFRPASLIDMAGQPIRRISCDGLADQAAHCAWVAQFVTQFMGSVGGGLPAHTHVLADMADAGDVGRLVLLADTRELVRDLLDLDEAGTPRPALAHAHAAAELVDAGTTGLAILAANDPPSACAAAGAATASHGHTPASIGAAPASHGHTPAEERQPQSHPGQHRRSNGQPHACRRHAERYRDNRPGHPGSQ